jgi:uncharacterized cysteine cluster protein YcgN (CxxCxxCC family)
MELERLITNIRVKRLDKKLKDVEDYDKRCEIVKKTMRVNDKGMIDYWASYWRGRVFDEREV